MAWSWQRACLIDYINAHPTTPPPLPTPLSPAGMCGLVYIESQPSQVELCNCVELSVPWFFMRQTHCSLFLPLLKWTRMNYVITKLPCLALLSYSHLGIRIQSKSLIQILIHRKQDSEPRLGTNYNPKFQYSFIHFNFIIFYSLDPDPHGDQCGRAGPDYNDEEDRWIEKKVVNRSLTIMSSLISTLKHF